MRILLSTFGTGGNIVPSTRLAAALLARGHLVTAHTWTQYQHWYPADVAFTPAAIDPDVEALHGALAEALSMASPWRQIRRFAELFYGLGGDDAPARAYFDRAAAVMGGQQLVVCDVLDHLGQAAAEAAGVPWIGWASRPPPAESDVARPLAAVDAALSALVSRVSGGERRVRTFRDASPLDNLVDASPALVRAAPRAPRHRVTGSWLGPAARGPLPAEVAAFVDAGPALLVSFGPYPDVRDRTARLLAAARRTGWRVLLQVLPPAAPPADVSPDTLVVAGRLPFGPLLPRVRAAVHHGGAGTCHAMCRAGRPCWAIPHMADQYYWSRALAAAGAGPAPTPIDRLDDATIEARLAALREPRYAQAAARVGAAIAEEDGVGVAVRVLEAAV